MTKDNVTNQVSEREGENITLIKRWFNEVFNERRIEAIEETLSPNFIGHYEHGKFQGFNGWKENIYDLLIKAIPDFHIELEDVIANGDYVVTRWKAQGIHAGELFGVPPLGKKIELSGMSWTKIIDGKIIGNWGNWNMSYLVRHLLAEVKALKGILPICCVCGLIRDDTGLEEGKGEWMKLDKFVVQKTDAQVSHTYCPLCYEKAMEEDM